MYNNAEQDREPETRQATAWMAGSIAGSPKAPEGMIVTLPQNPRGWAGAQAPHLTRRCCLTDGLPPDMEEKADGWVPRSALGDTHALLCSI